MRQPYLHLRLAKYCCRGRKGASSSTLVKVSWEKNSRTNSRTKKNGKLLRRRRRARAAGSDFSERFKVAVATVTVTVKKSCGFRAINNSLCEKLVNLKKCILAQG